MRLYLAHTTPPNLVLQAPTRTPDPLVLHKSFGEGDEWLRDFEGTDLFNDAVKLCERELDIKLAEHSREPEMPAVRKESTWDKLEKIRLEKKKLALQLAKQRHQQRKKMDAAFAVVKGHSSSKHGQHDLGPIIEALMDDLPGENLKKDGKR